MAKTNCETCVNYYYDDETEEYCCDINLDEDEMVRFLTSSNYQCPYYRLYDEYGIVKKQNQFLLIVFIEFLLDKVYNILLY